MDSSRALISKRPDAYSGFLRAMLTFLIRCPWPTPTLGSRDGPVIDGADAMAG